MRARRARRRGELGERDVARGSRRGRTARRSRGRRAAARPRSRASATAAACGATSASSDEPDADDAERRHRRSAARAAAHATTRAARATATAIPSAGVYEHRQIDRAEPRCATTKRQNSAAITRELHDERDDDPARRDERAMPAPRHRRSTCAHDRREQPRDRPRQRDRRTSTVTTANTGSANDTGSGLNAVSLASSHVPWNIAQASATAPSHDHADPAGEPRCAAAVLDEAELARAATPRQMPRISAIATSSSGSATSATKPAAASPAERRCPCPAPSRAPAAIAPAHAAAALGASQRAAERTRDFTSADRSARARNARAREDSRTLQACSRSFGRGGWRSCSGSASRRGCR